MNTNTNNQLLCARSAYLMLFLFGFSWVVLAQFFPPLDPSFGAAEITAIYQARPEMILLGMVVMMAAIVLYLPLFTVISLQLSRIEGRWPILSILQIVLGIATCMIALVAVMFFAAATFRVDQQDPNITLLLSDLGFITLLWPYAPAFFQSLVIALCILSDKNSQPVFPRWVGYYNIWVATLFLPGALLVFFKDGPLAWNGLLAFWLPTIDWFIFIIVMTYSVTTAIKQQKSTS